MAVQTNKNANPKSQGNTPVRVQDNTSKVAGMIFGNTVKQPIPAGSKGKMGKRSSCGE
mgnify:CR=1 FL=1